MYAAECWSLTERDEARSRKFKIHWARLDAFDMRCQREILRIMWSQHITNRYVRFLTKQPVLSNTIRKRRLQWFGHLQHMDNNRIPKRLYQWKPTHGKCRSARPRTTWKHVIQRDLSSRASGISSFLAFPFINYVLPFNQ